MSVNRMSSRKIPITAIALLSLTFYWDCINGTKQAVEDTSCDPVVDILFVLDKSPNVTSVQLTAQRNFIKDLLQNHEAPKGAVRIGLMVCGENNILSTPFLSSFSSLLDVHDESSFKADDSAEKRHCLKSVNFKFKSEARTGVARIAVILKSNWNWDEVYVRKQSKIARNENTVLVVITIGVSSFKSLSSMHSLASEDGTFFVMTDYKVLKKLATSLSKDSCKPISLDLTSESRFAVRTTNAPKSFHKLCIRLTGSMFKRHIPGFGYTRQTCSDSQTLNMTSCQCV